MNKGNGMRKRILSLIGIFFIAVESCLVPAQAQEPKHLSRKQIRLLMERTAAADECQTLASYFRYRELSFRAKAQNTFDEFVTEGGASATSTKSVSRAEVVYRLREHYLCLADKNATLAERYVARLHQLGVKPVVESATIVSVKSLHPVEKRRSALDITGLF